MAELKRLRWDLAATALLFAIVGGVAAVVVVGGFSRPAEELDSTHEGDHGPSLSEATLANFGVRLEPVQSTTFLRTVSIAAVTVDTPATEQPVFAPIGGRIESIEVKRGTVVSPGATVVTLVRDPLPRPQLTLTADILRPAQESLHEAVLELRTAAEEVRIARAELERVEKYTGSVGEEELPVIPRQRAIDLRYQLSRAERAHQQARLELVKHGLTETQIESVEAGAPLPEFNEDTWQRALARNGLWPDQAEHLSQALPESLRVLPWVTATVAELAASGLATEELTQWVSSPEVAEHFLELGVLLQRGHTVEDLKRLHELNALEPVVRVVAPSLADGGSWDVLDVLVKRGARVAAGDPVLMLTDPRKLLFRTDPVGGEVAAVLAAAKENYSIVAKPLIRGSGPVFDDLKIRFVESSLDNEGTVAFVEVTNRIHSEILAGNGSKSRTWELREGLRYVLSVPTEKLEDVFVFPAEAVTDDGPNKVVFLPDGDTFKPVPIVVAYQDHEVVVVPVSKKVALFPGDMVVYAGAFELGLAMKGSDAADAHAGHNH
ncbi:MAG: hypothetical protein AB7N24_22220 [Dehalococcoidia bacterium]